VKPLAFKRASFLSRKGRKGLTAEVAEKKNAQRSQRKKTKEVFTSAILSRKGFILAALKGRNIPARR